MGAKESTFVQCYDDVNDLNTEQETWSNFELSESDATNISEESSRVCYHCRIQTNSDARFCYKCGKELAQPTTKFFESLSRASSELRHWTPSVSREIQDLEGAENIHMTWGSRESSVEYSVPQRAQTTEEGVTALTQPALFSFLDENHPDEIEVDTETDFTAAARDAEPALSDFLETENTTASKGNFLDAQLKFIQRLQEEVGLVQIEDLKYATPEEAEAIALALDLNLGERLHFRRILKIVKNQKPSPTRDILSSPQRRHSTFEAETPPKRKSKQKTNDPNFEGGVTYGGSTFDIVFPDDDDTDTTYYTNVDMEPDVFDDELQSNKTGEGVSFKVVLN